LTAAAGVYPRPVVLVRDPASSPAGGKVPAVRVHGGGGAHFSGQGGAIVVSTGLPSRAPSGERSPEDRDFDAVYPASVRALSARYWTPVAVARRAAELFRAAGVTEVLDVGSGVGKFALAAAAYAPGIRFVGVEHRARLVEVARQAKAHLRLGNVDFCLGDASSADWSAYGGFYFFNPFAENLFHEGDEIDRTVPLSRKQFIADTLRAEHALREAPAGTVLVTYHGLSGRVPGCYEPVSSEPAGSDWLRAWRHRGDRRQGCYLELGEEVVLHRQALPRSGG
jgi:SAM-dependent methyltransferase